MPASWSGVQAPFRFESLHEHPDCCPAVSRWFYRRLQHIRTLVGRSYLSAGSQCSSPEQRTAGFAMQSFFIGTGAVIASALPYMMTNWFGISNVAPEGEIPASVKFSFYVGAIVFFLAVVWTVFSTKEYSPEELKKYWWKPPLLTSDCR